MKRITTMLFAVCIVLVFASQSLADSNCHDVNLNVTTSAVDPMLPFGGYAGTAQFSIDGQAPLQAAVTLSMVSVKIGEDGTILPTNSMTFDFGSLGTLSAQDDSVLTPTEEPYIYRINARLLILSGTGTFTGAIGKLSDHGETSFATTIALVEGKGRICW